MPIYFPDTNILSVFLRGNDSLLNSRMEREYPHVRLSALVVAEREFGIVQHLAGGRYRARFDAFVSTVPVEPFTREDAARYATIRSALENKGSGIGPIDTLIAAQALRLGAVVVTHNLREFRRVPTLEIEDWQSA